MKKSALVLLLLAALLFVAGLVHLFHLRFASGDVYPAYSSLRADPLGAKALHDSLDGLVAVRRNFSPLERLVEGRETTLLHLGSATEAARFSTNQYRTFDRFLRTGGRLVLAFHPEYVRFRLPRQPPPTRTAPAPLPGTNAPPGPQSRRSAPARADDGTIPIHDRWQLELGVAPLSRESTRDAFTPAVATRRIAGPLPAQILVHTAVYFDPLSPDWKVIYARSDGTNDYPVVLERSFGGGSLVVVADAYPFSNEALRRERQSQLLTWFLGGRGQVIFEETHLGTRGDPGIVSLARRYRLHGLAAALVLLAALVFWRASSSFIPATHEATAESTHQVAGKDSAEGFIHLLQRHIAPVDLLAVCVEQWKQSLGRGRQPSAARLEAMQQLINEQNALEPRQRRPVETYRRFCEILSKRT
jgi:hypothetical protein